MTSRAPRTLAVALAVALTLPLVACSDERNSTLRVLAAASLTDAFADLAARFELEHPAIDVELSFASSTSLAEQAADGAPGDVLATADPTAMDVAVTGGVVTDPARFATNRMVLVTPPDNPAGVASPADLAGTAWVRCADAVPCGRAALALLARLGVADDPVSLEEDVRSALEKVTAGEADAALVYATDAVAAGDDVASIPVADAGAAATTYLIAQLTQARSPEAATDFVDLVTGPEGRRVLGGAGFGTP